MSETLDRPVCRTFSFLTGDGDNTYGWDAKDDSWVIPMIQKKMNEGYTFWIVKREPLREVKLRTADETKDTGRNVIIKDGDARILFEQGRIGLVSQAPNQRGETITRERRATSAADAAAHDTVAHRAPVGG